MAARNGFVGIMKDVAHPKNSEGKMEDPCKDKVSRVVVNAGRIIRELKGLPEEKDITALYKEAAPFLGIYLPGSSKAVDHRAPSPRMKEEKRKLNIPKKDCPSCKEKDCMELFDLCRGCQKVRKYKTKWQCLKCNFKEKSEKAYVQWLDELGIDFKPGLKVDLGIKTSMDEGG